MQWQFRRPRLRCTTLEKAACVASALLVLAVPVPGQKTACPAAVHEKASAAELAYGEGRYQRAEDLYGQQLAAHPGDLDLSAGLVKTWLHEGEVEQASAQVNRVLASAPHSAVALTMLAEVQLHQGQPWLALETLKEAERADPCNARVHYVRSRALRIDSMYASERAEVQAAYDIDPTDPDIRHAWLSTVSIAREVEGIDSSLKTMQNLDAETKQKALDSIHSMLPMLSENNRTCEVLPTEEAAGMVLQPSYADAKHVEGYKIEVQFPKSKAKLQIDTAASGMFVSRALAEANGLEYAAGAPPGTVHVDRVQIGPLEFHDCTVGVSDTPFAGKGDGFISTDMFAQYLITLDNAAGKLTLSPLPAQAGVVPGDRVVPAGLEDYTPVYHRKQFLLVPVDVNRKGRRLFALDSGIRLSSMAPSIAHAVSTTKVNFTNPIQTVSGSTLQVYRDNFDFAFARQTVDRQGHILEMDPSAIGRATGVEVGGLLGFDMLHSMIMHLDYRDGLVKFESSDGSTQRPAGSMAAGGAKGEAEVECAPDDTRDRPLGSAMQAKVTGLLESSHLKPGKQVTVALVNGWEDAECSLSPGALLYGHVTEAEKVPGGAQLSLMFDHADCDGHAKKELALRVIGLVASPDAFVGLHNALPSEVAGGARDISVTAQNMGAFALDENLNPGGPPHTIHPGIVAGLPKIKLQPIGGPGCSARLISSDANIRLGVGAQLLLSREVSRLAAK